MLVYKQKYMKTVTVIVAKLSEKTDNRSETMALNSPGGSTLQCGTGQGLICTEPLFSSGYYYTVLWISYTLCKKSQAHVPGCEEPLKAKSPTDLARKVDSCMLRVFLAGWYTTCNSRQHLVERQSLFSSAFWTLNPTKPIHTPCLLYSDLCVIVRFMLFGMSHDTSETDTGWRPNFLWNLHHYLASLWLFRLLRVNDH